MQNGNSEVAGFTTSVCVLAKLATIITIKNNNNGALFSSPDYFL